MGKVVTGAFQATGKKMTGANPEANFAKPAKVGVVKATEPMAPSAAPKPFVRPVLPGTRVAGGGTSMKTASVGGIQRQYPTKVAAGALSVSPHQINPGE